MSNTFIRRIIVSSSRDFVNLISTIKVSECVCVFEEFPERGFFSILPLRSLFVYLPVIWILLLPLHTLISHLSCGCAPGGHEIILQVNPLVYLTYLMVWCDTSCKIFSGNIWGKSNTYWSYRRSTCCRRTAPH